MVREASGREMNLYQMFRANQRVMFVFDMFLWDRTGCDFVFEGGSIDKQPGFEEESIVEGNRRTPKKRKPRCEDDQ